MNSKVLLACAGAALLTACAHNRSQTVNEPAGAAVNHNDVEGLLPRDLNQQPYPGLHPNYDEWWEVTPRAPSLGPSPEEDVKMARPEETQDQGTDKNKDQSQP